MAAALEEDFESWLSYKLKALNTDESVFGSYITGILEGDETIEEKNEALEGILVEITEEDITKHCQEIIGKWEALNQQKQEAASNTTTHMNVEDRLAQLLEPTKQDLITQREYTEEEKKIREAILSQYAETSDHENSYDEDEDKPSGAISECSGGYRNMNVALVAQAEKEKRERAKVESQMKKEKDKADREKHKQVQQEKKEKRKTQKQERRR